MSGREPRTINLRIECTDLPRHDWEGHAVIWLGIQRGKEVVQEVRLPAGAITFDAELRVSADGADGMPNFLGPYAHGTSRDRFIYLCWGCRHTDVWVGFRRAKLSLSQLTWEMLQSNRVLAKVHSTDAKGGPICATIRSEYVTWSSAAD